MVSVASVKDKAADTREQLQQLRDQIEALMNDRVTPAVSDMATRATSTYRAASDSVQDNAEALAGQVRDKPLVAILIAAGAGYLLGRIFR